MSSDRIPLRSDDPDRCHSCGIIHGPSAYEYTPDDGMPLVFSAQSCDDANAIVRVVFAGTPGLLMRGMRP